MVISNSLRYGILTVDSARVKNPLKFPPCDWQEKHIILNCYKSCDELLVAIKPHIHFATDLNNDVHETTMYIHITDTQVVVSCLTDTWQAITERVKKVQFCTKSF